jgi:nucleotide-binding universal stress UspA family protein
MTKVIAAVDNSLAATPVVRTGAALANLFGATLEVLHVEDDGDAVAARAAETDGLRLRTEQGPVAEVLVRAASEPDVVALVVGARSTPAGRRPAGGTALAVATSVDKPVVVVPPDGRVGPLRRALVPIEADDGPGLAPRAIVEPAQGAQLEVVVLHVLDEERLPSFTDQPQHETAAWAREFLRRYWPWGIGAVTLETRIGRAEELVPVVADETDADIVVLAWAQDLAPHHAPVVESALARGHVPVMLLPVSVTARTGTGSQPPALVR